MWSLGRAVGPSSHRSASSLTPPIAGHKLYSPGGCCVLEPINHFTSKLPTHLKKGGKMKKSGLWEGGTCSPLSPPSGRNVWQVILRAVPKNTQSCSHCTVSRCSPSGANTQIHVNGSRPVAQRRNESLSRGNGIAMRVCACLDAWVHVRVGFFSFPSVFSFYMLCVGIFGWLRVKDDSLYYSLVQGHTNSAYMTPCAFTSWSAVNRVYSLQRWKKKGHLIVKIPKGMQIRQAK